MCTLSILFFNLQRKRLHMCQVELQCCCIIMAWPATMPQTSSARASTDRKLTRAHGIPGGARCTQHTEHSAQSNPTVHAKHTTRPTAGGRSTTMPKKSLFTETLRDRPPRCMAYITFHDFSKFPDIFTVATFIGTRVLQYGLICWSTP